jgi:hypothetical protein
MWTEDGEQTQMGREFFCVILAQPRPEGLREAWATPPASDYPDCYAAAGGRNPYASIVRRLAWPRVTGIR